MPNYTNRADASKALRKERRVREGIQPVLTSGVDIKTINGESVLGTGDLEVGGGGYPQGVSFPGSPVSGDKFYRTDLNWLCFYDGTRWLTCHEYTISFNYTGAHPSGNGSALLAFRAGMPSDYAAYFTNAYISVEAGSSNHNGSNYTTLSLYTLGATNTTSVTLATQLTSAGITAGNTAKYDISVNTACPLADTRLILTATHTGTVTNAYVYPIVNYRLIVT